MARDDVQKLYKRLVSDQFDFMPHGEHHILSIYQHVKQRFPRYCDDAYLCCENCQSIHRQPEWKHSVRSALQSLKNPSSRVTKGARRGHWRFWKQADIGVVARRFARPKTCTKCGDTNFGWWTSSATGAIKPYCRPCRDERQRNYVARKRENGGSHTHAQWLKKLARYDRCPGCKRRWSEIEPRPNPRYKFVWTKDHIKPLSKGGTDDIRNIQPLCYQCQFHKNARHD